MLVLALAAAVVQPQPGELKTFGDWTVGCDNARSCQAVALVPEGEDRDAYLLLVVKRDAGPNARPVLTFTTEKNLPGSFAMRVDGKPVLRIARASLLPVPPELADGRRATLTDGQGRTLASASLAGLSAAFLYIDERQGRIGTVGALRRKGTKSDSAVPAPPPLPRVVQPRSGPKPPRSLTAAAAVRLIGPENAACEDARGPVRPRVFRLDATHSLALVEHPCGNGAYNIMSSAFVVDEAGRAAPARFDAAPGMDGEPGHILVNAAWNAGARRLTDFVKARGLGDCGGRGEYAWDGERFRLVRQEAMGECRGSTDYITTWRAAVATAR